MVPILSWRDYLIPSMRKNVRILFFLTHRKHDVNEWIKKVMWQLVLGFWIQCRRFCSFELFFCVSNVVPSKRKYANNVIIHAIRMQLIQLICIWFKTFPCCAIRANVNPSGAPIISPESHEQGQTLLLIIHKIFWPWKYWLILEFWTMVKIGSRCGLIRIQPLDRRFPIWNR